MDEQTSRLIEKALAGDKEAFENVIRLFARAVFAKAYLILQEKESAEDIVQETFIKAFQNRDQLQDGAKFPSWLFSIARNLSVDYVRKFGARPLDSRILHMENEDLKKPDQELSGKEARQKIHSAISTLPERHRQVILLRYMEEMDYKTIQKLLGISDGTLRGILGRGLKMLRKELNPVLLRQLS